MSTIQTSLGATIRVWRDRLTPAQVGLPEGWTRRAVGLRREELADLAGVSVDYVIRLEQGRATSPSAQVVAALARALQLTRDERDHLYTLAGLRPPGDRMISDHVTPGVQRLLTRLGDVAVAVFAADWRMIWWSRTWAALLGDPSVVAPEERNFLIQCFPTPGHAAQFVSWPVHSGDQAMTDRATVADMRRASVRYPEDGRLTELIQRTLEGNERFAELWRTGAVGVHTEDRKTIRHPVVGDVTVDCDVLYAGDADLRIVAMTAAVGSEDAGKIDLARVTGTTFAR